MLTRAMLSEWYEIVRVIYKEGRIHWPNVVLQIYAHIAAVVAITMLPLVKWQTIALVCFLVPACNMGVEVGAHRLWSHRSFKASLPMRVVLLTLYAIAGQQSVIWWARIHRAHHKHSDTIKDPHGVQRGWFFTQFGWFMTHPDKQ